MEEETDLPGIDGTTIEVTLDERWRPLIINVDNIPSSFNTEGYLQMIRETGIMPLDTRDSYSVGETEWIGSSFTLQDGTVENIPVLNRRHVGLVTLENGETFDIQDPNRPYDPTHDLEQLRQNARHSDLMNYRSSEEEIIHTTQEGITLVNDVNGTRHYNSDGTLIRETTTNSVRSSLNSFHYCNLYDVKTELKAYYKELKESNTINTPVYELLLNHLEEM